MNEKENLEERNFSQVGSSKNIASKSKRPTQNLYIPRHMRNEEKKSLNNNECIQNTVIATKNNNSINEHKNFSPINDSSIIGYITDSSKSRHSIETDSPIKNTEPHEENLILNKLASLNISNSKPLEMVTQQTNIENKPNSKSLELKEKFNKLEPSNDKNKDKDKLETDWFDIYDDSGDSLKPTKSVKKNEDGQKTIDYLKFEPQSENLDEEEYGHILEIYDFPAVLKTENIFSSLKEYTGHTDFDIKWIDDTHCLGVFASPSAALTVLQQNTNPLIKTRPLSKAIPESKSRAQRLVNYLKPYKPRPQTTSFVASRLIGASLGLNSLIPKEKLKLEKKKLDSARDTKRKDREIKDAIWNGK